MRLFLWLVLLMLPSQYLGAGQGSKNIYILFGVGYVGQWEQSFANSFQEFLKKDRNFTTTLFIENLGHDRSLDAASEKIMLANLERKLKAKPADVVIGVLPGACRLLFEQRNQLFKNTKKIYVLPKDQALIHALKPDESVVKSVSDIAIKNTIKLMFQLFPQNRKVVVVSGVSETDEHYYPIIMENFRKDYPNVELALWKGDTQDELKDKMKTLSKNTSIFFASVELDRYRYFYGIDDVMSVLSAGHVFPIFAFHDAVMGKGVLGGDMTRANNYAQESYLLVKNYFGDHKIAIGSNLTTPIFDFRELKRFGISENQLPAENVVLFKEITFWQLYRVYILLVAFTLVLQSVLIALLITIWNRQEKYKNELRDRLEQLQIISNNFNNGMIYQIMMTPDGVKKFTYLSNSVQLYYGVSPAAAIDDPSLIYRRVYEQDFERLIEAENFAARNLSMFKMELRVKEPDGKLRWSSFVSTPRLQLDGSILWDGIEFVITEKIEFEEKLIQLNQELVASIEKANSYARQAELSNKAKSEFLSNIGHEIRTPLNCVIGFTSCLSEKTLDIESVEYLDRIKRSGESLLAIVNNVLEISKIEAKENLLELRSVDLRELVHDTIEMIRIRANAKNLTLKVNFNVKNSDLPIIADHYHLQRVLINILSNAVKFTDQGEIILTINMEMQEGRKYIEFAVVDTGIGIPSAKRELIFERFTQLDLSSTKRFEGTGLGLSISKELLILMGGGIDCLENPNGGTIFRFWIPFEKAKDQGRGESVRNKENELVLPDQLKILLVDDSLENRHLMTAFLKKYNYTLDEAVNGEDAIIKFKANKYDIIFMDMQMPICDGHEATARIRQWEQAEQRKPTPIIAITAYAFKEDSYKCLAVGCNDHVAKPVSKPTILQIIAKYASQNS